MKKEEILKKSREENKNKDMYEIQVESKGATYAAISMLILATIYYCFEIFSGKGTNPGFYSLIALYCSVVYGWKAIKLEKRRALHIFTSAIWGVMTILLILEYFGVL